MNDSSSRPLVSVIMPVYNTERYVAESVSSVLGQTFSDFELICFDDASTDSSPAILDRLATSDGRMTVIHSPVNVKQGGGRNGALRVARGKYVLFLDSDDALEPDALAETVNVAESNGADAVFFDWSLYYPSRGQKIRVYQLGDDSVNIGGDQLRRRIIRRSTSIWSALYRRELITDNALFFPEGMFYEDNAVALPIQLMASNPVKIDRALYLYRQDNVSVTRSTGDDRFFDRIEAAVIQRRHLQRLGVYDRFPEELDYVFIQQYLVHTVYGAVYRFDSPRTDRINQVSDGIKEYVPDFRKNRYYRAQPFAKKLKLEAHLRCPRLIHRLSTMKRKFLKR